MSLSMIKTPMSEAKSSGAEVPTAMNVAPEISAGNFSSEKIAKSLLDS